MALTEAQIKALPVMPKDTKAVAGKDTLMYIALSQDPLTWLLLGGQKNSPISLKAGSLDGSDKTSGGWSKNIAGMKSWSIEYDGLFVLNDTALDVVRHQFREGQPIYARIEYPDGSYMQGWAAITEFSDSNASDAIHTLKISLTGYGAISDFITPAAAAIATPSATMPAATPADQTIDVTPTDVTIRGITDDGTGRQLVFGADYTFAAGKLTLKKEYLKALAKGVHTLSVKFAASTIPVKVTIS